MKKTFKVNDLDCAHCAAKMEEAIRKIPGVINANMNFLAQKLIVEAEDDRLDMIMKEAVKVCKKIEPDCEIVLK